MGDNGRAGELAAAVADGTPVDWDSESRAAGDPGDLALLRSLRLISRVAEIHRVETSRAGEARSGIQDLETLPSPTGKGEHAAEARRRPEPGEPGRHDVWGSLEILELVGRGTFGEVFRAWDRTLDREVALKLLSPEAPGHEVRAAAIAREGRLLARIRHPNVVTVYGAGEAAGRTGLWMEFIRGRTLEALLQEQGTLGAREAALIGMDLCRALAAVHGAGLVHRDVKTRNVMREEGGRTVLMDFGAGEEAALQSGSTPRGVTGTPLYVAPEIFRGQEASPRSDLFSLGVLLYRVVTGAYPVEARTLTELREAHLRMRRRLLRDARPDLPDPFVKAVERALAPDPADRFASAGEMEQALAAALGVEGGRPAAVQGRDRDGSPAEAGAIRHTLTPFRVAAAASLAAAVLVALVVLPRWGDGQGTIREDRAAASPPDDSPAAGPSGEAGIPPETGRRETRPGKASATAPPTSGADGESRLQRASPPSVEATLFQRGGIADRPLPTGSDVRPEDRLYLEVSTAEPMHLYVLDQDEAGHAFVLFPLPGSDLKNPLAPGRTHRLPGSVEGTPIYWVVSSAGGRETFLVIASKDRLTELEDLLSGLEQAELGRPVEATPPMVAALRRGIGGLGKEPPPSAVGSPFERLREVLRPRGAGRTPGEAVWVREIVLENPGI